jgi:CrcB protein
MTPLWVFLAGGAGSLTRYLVAGTFARMSTFPYGTVTVNLMGCFVLGVVAHLATAWAWSQETRAAVVVGFLGGFTTYSSFNHETTTLLAAGSIGAALLNVTITLFGGLATGWLGLVAARQLMA